MFIAFPVDKKVKARLDSVCKSLEVTYEEWFETALIDSELYVLSMLLSSNPEEQADWKWDAGLCRFVRGNDD